MASTQLLADKLAINPHGTSLTSLQWCFEGSSNDMAVPSVAVPHPAEYYLGLVEKQSKRIAQLARFLPFAEQEHEMELMARELKMAVAHFRLLIAPDPQETVSWR